MMVNPMMNGRVLDAVVGESDAHTYVQASESASGHRQIAVRVLALHFARRGRPTKLECDGVGRCQVSMVPMMLALLLAYMGYQYDCSSGESDEEQESPNNA